MKLFHKLLLILLAFTLFTGCRKPVNLPSADPDPTADIPVVTLEPTPEATEKPEDPDPAPDETVTIDEDGIYDTAEEVALYLHTYRHLPSNFMTKKEARKKGWSSGALNKTIKGKCIGGDVYGNYEGTLPDIKGKYYECDIGTLNARSRGAKRLVWSEDFDIYYTEDHYETFELLYEGDS